VTCTATDNAGNNNSASVNYTVQAAGTVVGTCGGYEVRQVGSVYSAAGWNGAIKAGTSGNNTLNGTNGADLMIGLGGNDKLDGNDLLDGGTGDRNQLLGSDGNDVLLDGNDLLTIALRNGWRDVNGQPRFAGLAAGYSNDSVGLAILNPVRFFVDITGDERDNLPSPLEGNNDGLALAGVIDPASVIIKFERRVGAASAESAAPPSFEDFTVDPTTLTDESGPAFLTEPVGGEESVAEGEQEEGGSTLIFLPLINR